jgi:hypothetical protein
MAGAGGGGAGPETRDIQSRGTPAPPSARSYRSRPLARSSSRRTAGNTRGHEGRVRRLVRGGAASLPRHGRLAGACRALARLRVPLALDTRIQNEVVAEAGDSAGMKATTAGSGPSNGSRSGSAICRSLGYATVTPSRRRAMSHPPVTIRSAHPTGNSERFTAPQSSTVERPSQERLRARAPARSRHGRLQGAAARGHAHHRQGDPRRAPRPRIGGAHSACPPSSFLHNGSGTGITYPLLESM